MLGVGDIVVHGYAHRSELEGRVVCGTVIDNGFGQFVTKLSFSSAFPKLLLKDRGVKKFEKEIRIFAMYKALTMLDDDMFRAYRPQENHVLTEEIIRQVAIYLFTINAVDRLRHLLSRYGQFFKDHLDLLKGEDILTNLGMPISQYLDIPLFLTKLCNAIYWCRPTTALKIGSKICNVADDFEESRRHIVELYREAVSDVADDAGSGSKCCREYDYCACSTLPTEYVTVDFYKMYWRLPCVIIAENEDEAYKDLKRDPKFKVTKLGVRGLPNALHDAWAGQHALIAGESYLLSRYRSNLKRTQRDLDDILKEALSTFDNYKQSQKLSRNTNESPTGVSGLGNGTDLTTHKSVTAIASISEHTTITAITANSTKSRSDSADSSTASPLIKSRITPNDGEIFTASTATLPDPYTGGTSENTESSDPASDCYSWPCCKSDSFFDILTSTSGIIDQDQIE
ncbi:hypothetical protein INT43_000850 [Umbelopsis isabellina]|uniref:Uncharacterized protein n=1 Tax=Mortierella isabellina TaxID=91625 RepID=A0A8H7Q2V8_MORIS|nr:hypothetical protein INT43_000850 [Umbelopsis isabellina]